jgi:transcriptional regulator with XRE-family HTH domain
MPARVNPDVPGEAKLLRAVGKRLRLLREKEGLTMAELGQSPRGIVYFQRQYVWKMETGRVAPSLAALAHFAKRLDVTIAELLKGIR